jgi:hypothetical protein
MYLPVVLATLSNCVVEMPVLSGVGCEFQSLLLEAKISVSTNFFAEWDNSLSPVSDPSTLYRIFGRPASSVGCLTNDGSSMEKQKNQTQTRSKFTGS